MVSARRSSVQAFGSADTQVTRLRFDFFFGGAFFFRSCVSLCTRHPALQENGRAARWIPLYVCSYFFFPDTPPPLLPKTIVSFLEFFLAINVARGLERSFGISFLFFASSPCREFSSLLDIVTSGLGMTGFPETILLFYMPLSSSLRLWAVLARWRLIGGGARRLTLRRAYGISTTSISFSAFFFPSFDRTGCVVRSGEATVAY